MSTNLGHSKCNPSRTGTDFAMGVIMTSPPLDKVGLRVGKMSVFWWVVRKPLKIELLPHLKTMNGWLTEEGHRRSCCWTVLLSADDGHQLSLISHTDQTLEFSLSEFDISHSTDVAENFSLNYWNYHWIIDGLLVKELVMRCTFVVSSWQTLSSMS